MTKMTRARFNKADAGKAVHALMDIGDGNLKPIWVTGIADGVVRYQTDDTSKAFYMDEKVFMKCNVYENPFWERL